jgi:proliferating cell nuclear antigen
MNAEEPDNLQIKFETDGIKSKSKKGTVGSDLKKSFKLPLIEYEYDEMNIPSPEYEAEFSYSSKQISDVFSQLGDFGDDIIVKCSENEINLMSKGVNGEMMVNIPIDELTSFSIIEGEEIILTYSLVYINKMCITNKLSDDIDLSLSNECPLKINYNLGEDSSLVFFIAPKMNDHF